jgi:hypothetical protein
MTPNKRDLKAYSRFDGTGRIVPGSTVLRRNKPKNGNWKEVQAYECCNVDQSPILISVIDSYPFSYPDLTLNASGIFTLTYLADNTTVTNITTLTAYLNKQYNTLGNFRVVGTDIYLSPNADTAAMFASFGATTVTGYTFAD